MRALNRRGVMLLCLLLSPIFLGIAAADNCSPDNQSDCERTAGYNTGLAVGGVIAAVGAALFGSSLGSNGTDPDPDSNGDGDASELSVIFGTGEPTDAPADPGPEPGLGNKRDDPLNRALGEDSPHEPEAPNSQLSASGGEVGDGNG